MIYLVDVNVLSEPTKTKPAAKAVDWLRQNERDLVVDPIILGEGKSALPKSTRLNLELVNQQRFDGDAVHLHYRVNT